MPTRPTSEVEARFGAETMRKVERHVMLTIIDKLWVEHLTAMDELREGVGLQAYGQKDPLVVYKTEGYEIFQQLLASIQHDVVHTIFRVQPVVGAATRADAGHRRIRQESRRRGWRGNGANAAQVAQDRRQRALPLRQRQEVQALPRRAGRTNGGVTVDSTRLLVHVARRGLFLRDGLLDTQDIERTLDGGDGAVVGDHQRRHCVDPPSEVDDRIDVAGALSRGEERFAQLGKVVGRDRARGCHGDFEIGDDPAQIDSAR